MLGKIVLALSLAALSGCVGETRYTRTGNGTYELSVKDNGIMGRLNSSRLEDEWKNEAEKICPRGYTVQSRTYSSERSFDPAEMIGTISCR